VPPRNDFAHIFIVICTELTAVNYFCPKIMQMVIHKVSATSGIFSKAPTKFSTFPCKIGCVLVISSDKIEC